MTILAFSIGAIFGASFGIVMFAVLTAESMMTMTSASTEKGKKNDKERSD